MKLSSTAAVAALTLFIGHSTAAKVVSQKIQKIKLPPNLIQSGMHQRHRRQTLDLTAVNNITGGGYYSEIEVGTPPQTVLVHLDTGSSDTWVLAAESDLCASKSLQAQHGYCTEPYDREASSSYELVEEDGFSIEYLDGRAIEGDYFVDTVGVGGQKVEGQQLGLGLTSLRNSGLMGLGLSIGVSTAFPYPTLVDSMAEQGLIGRKAFSVWLNSIDSEGGSILFGGIDTEKFIGRLTTLPLVPALYDGLVSHWAVGINSIKLLEDDDDEQLTPASFSGAAVLDTGSTLTILPDDMVDVLFEKFDVFDDIEDIGLADCAWAGPKGDGVAVEFAFDEGATIRVPMSELLIDNVAEILEEQGVDVGFRVCMFGIQKHSLFAEELPDNFVLLGDTVLRSAYVVYDEANEQVGIAQAVTNSTAENIIELEAGETALPTQEGQSTPSESSSSVSSEASSTTTAVPSSESSSAEASSSSSSAEAESSLSSIYSSLSSAAPSLPGLSPTSSEDLIIQTQTDVVTVEPSADSPAPTGSGGAGDGPQDEDLVEDESGGAGVKAGRALACATMALAVGIAALIVL